MEEVTIWKIVATFDLLKYICNVVTEVVLLLVDNGADHNLKYWYNMQHYKHNVATEFLRLFLDNGADHNFKNHNTIH